MPHFIIVKTIYALNNVKKSLNGAKILVLGVAYKKDISDARETPTEHIISLLMKKHADVSYNDPYIPEYSVNGKTLKSVELNEKSLKNADAVIIATDHSAYDPEFIKKHAQIIIDTRNIIKSRDNENFYHL